MLKFKMLLAKNYNFVNLGLSVVLIKVRIPMFFCVCLWPTENEY